MQVDAVLGRLFSLAKKRATPLGCTRWPMPCSVV